MEALAVCFFGIGVLLASSDGGLFPVLNLFGAGVMALGCVLAQLEEDRGRLDD